MWHRDIKPANLLITPQGRLKVTDFGIARIESTQLTQQGKVIGSPGYMAPERYGDAPTDHRVDLFSAGVLLYELLTGVAPFRGSPSQVMDQVLGGELAAPPSGLPVDDAPPPAFDGVTACALARDPAERFAYAATMRAAIAAAARRPLRPTVQPETLRRLRAARPEDVTEGLARPGARPAPFVRVVRTLPIAPAPPTLAPAMAPAVAPAAAPAPAREPLSPAPAATAALPPAVVATPESAARWDPLLLDRLTALLVPMLGPIAVVMVRQAARRCSDGETLLAQLAVDSLSERERHEFVTRARALLPPGTRTPTRPGAELPPVVGHTPMAPEVLVHAERWLTSQLGPMARLLVRRAAAEATSRETFFAAIADQLACDVDRKAVLAQLWRVCGSRA